MSAESEKLANYENPTENTSAFRAYLVRPCPIIAI